MARPSTYKICDTHEEGKEVWMKSTKIHVETCKIINVYQIKLCNMCDTMGFTVDEIVEILESFEYQKIETPRSGTYHEVDIYEVWEWGCTTKCPYLVIDEDMTNPKYNNESADKIMNEVYARTMEYYKKEYPDMGL
jgi:hypothetical protein